MSEDNLNEEPNMDDEKMPAENNDYEKMTNEQREKLMNFILNQQAKAEAEMQQQREQTNRLEKEAEEFRKEMREFNARAELDRQYFREFADDIRDSLNAFADKVSEDISRLVEIVENSRDFTQQVARLAIATEKRVARLEER